MSNNSHFVMTNMPNSFLSSINFQLDLINSISARVNLEFS